MINLENSGIPRDDQLPDIPPATLRLLADRIVTDDEARGVTAAGVVHRPWLRRSALLAAAAAGAVAVTATLLPSPPAEAWSATPSLAQGSARADLAADCQDMLDTSAPAVLVERRGTSSFTVLADSSMCLNAADLPGLDGAGALRAGGQDRLPADVPGPGQVQVVHANSLGGVGIPEPGTELPDGAMTAGYMGVTGRAGTEVQNVVIHTADLGDITASMQNGWFAAWWQSLDAPTSLTVTTSTGTYDLDL